MPMYNPGGGSGGGGSFTPSMVRLNGHTGYGSTNTQIQRFTTVVANTGSAITYADSATLGGTFTINATGVYSIMVNNNFTGISNFGLSLNSSQLTTAISGITATDALAWSTVAAAAPLVVSWCGILNAGDVIRSHASASAVSVATAVKFTITRVA